MYKDLRIRRNIGCGITLRVAMPPTEQDLKGLALVRNAAIATIKIKNLNQELERKLKGWV